jgi:hypothetical protein
MAVLISIVLSATLALGAIPGHEFMPMPVVGHSEEILMPANTGVEPGAIDFFADETLHYDGVPYTGVGLTSGGTFYTAARFTPTTACTLKAVLFYQWHNSSNDYV